MVDKSLVRLFKGLNTTTATWRKKWPKLHAPHAAKTMEMIGTAIDRCQQRQDATIVGLGAGVEFGRDGLAQIARAFPHVLVADVDIKTAKETVQRLPAGARRGIDVVQADVSGNVVTEFVRAGQEAIAKSRSIDKAIEHGVAIIRTLEPQATFDAGHADFVCSSLVMTQFGSGMRRQFRDTLTRKFGEARTKTAAQGTFLRATTGLETRLHREHLRNIHRWLRPGGAAYFADTFQELEGTTVAANLVAWGWRSDPMFNRDEVDRGVAQLFGFRENDRWIWTKKQRVAGSQRRLSAYLVCGYALAEPR